MNRAKQRVGESLLKLTLALVIAFAPFSLQAVIVDNGTFTTDTESQLSWYDVTLTRGMSYNDVNAQLQGHGTLANLGLRYASRNEVEELLDHAIGIRPFQGTSEGFSIPPHIVPQFIEFQALLGITSGNFSPSRNVTETIGLVVGCSIGFPDPDRCTIGLHADTSPLHLSNNFVNLDTGPQNDAIGSPGVGSYLVRDASFIPPNPVPTPTTLWLVLAASIGILLATRRIKITKFRTSVWYNTSAANA